MNYKMMGRFLSLVFLAEAVFMIPSLLLAIFEEGREKTVFGFGITVGILAAISLILFLFTHKAEKDFFAREGLFCVASSWVLMSLFGALPFVFSQEIPNFVDALFEIVSGFTTTGASVVSNVEGLSMAVNYWRCFSHWLGGMGVLVLLLAVMPTGKNAGFTIHLFRAESPGPEVSRLTPRLKTTAATLYLTYLALTLANFLFLVFDPTVSLFDAVCTAFATAGTGGFGIYNDSLTSFSLYAQIVTAVFMFLFGINFSIYFSLIVRRMTSVLKDEEMHFYFGVVFFSIAAITLNLMLTKTYTAVGIALKDTAFSVASVVSTTGFSVADFGSWPTFSKVILVFLMFLGACAGSTCGGMKCSRFLIIAKNVKRTVSRMLHPKKVESVTVNGSSVSDAVVATTTVYFCAEIFLLVVSMLFISLFDNADFTTNLTAVIASFNNIGPGLGQVGPTGNFAFYSAPSKIILIFDMLAGRLEIFPLLIFFSPSLWKGMTKDNSTPIATAEPAGKKPGALRREKGKNHV